MKVLFIADTHGCIRLKEYGFAECIKQEYDCCIILGDVYRSDIECIIEEIRGRIPIYGIHGNHDEKTLFHDYDIYDIEKCTFDKKNLTFTALGGCHQYNKNKPFQYSHLKSLLLFNKLKKSDILLTHDSAWHMHKESYHPGLLGISWYIVKNRPKFHVYGHHHVNKEKITHRIKYICVYGCKIIEF